MARIPYFRNHLVGIILGMGLVFVDPSLGSAIAGLTLAGVSVLFGYRKWTAMDEEAADRRRRAQEAGS